MRRQITSFAILMLCILSMPITPGASPPHVMAVILADGTIVNIGYCNWSATLQPGQTQVDMGVIEIPDNVLLGYYVVGAALVPRPTPLTTQQYWNEVYPGQTPPSSSGSSSGPSSGSSPGS